MAIGVQLIDAGERLRGRLDRLTPALVPANDVWRCTYRPVARMSHTFEHALAQMHERMDLEAGYIRLVVAVEPDAASAAWNECTRIVGKGTQPKWTVVVCSAALSPPTGAGDTVILVVPTRLPSQAQSAERQLDMISSWVAFVADLAGQARASQRWQAWFDDHCRASSAGELTTHKTFLGLAARRSLEPGTIQDTLARRLALDVCSTVAEVFETSHDTNTGSLARIDLNPNENGGDAQLVAERIADSVAEDVFGMTGEPFDADRAAEKCAQIEDHLVDRLTAVAKTQVTTAQRQQVRWRSEFGRAIDGELRRGGWGALAQLARELELAGFGSRPSASRSRVEAGKPVPPPKIPPIGSVVDAMNEWTESEPDTAPDGTVAAGWFLLFGTCFGLALGGVLHALRFDPLATSTTAQQVPPWLRFDWLAGGIAVGVALSAVVSVGVWAMMTRGERGRTEKLRQRFITARLDWTDQVARSVDRTLSDLLGRYRDRGDAFRNVTLFRTYRSLRCIQRAVNDHLDLFATAGGSGEQVMSDTFYRQARKLGRADQIVTELTAQLGEPSWSYELDLMDDEVLLSRCRAAFAEFSERIPIDRHPNLTPHVQTATAQQARDLHRQISKLLHAGAAGHWYFSGPVPLAAPSELVVGLKSVKTVESTYVMFTGPWEPYEVADR